MAFSATTEIPAYVRTADVRFSLSRATAADYNSPFDAFDVLKDDILGKVTFGTTTYPLRVPALHGFFIPPLAGRQGRFRVEEFGFVAGNGDDLAAAKKDWTENFHILVQGLLAKRPFEMSLGESSEWETVSSNVDLPAYLNQLRIKVRRFGIAKDMRSGHFAIEWDSGELQRVALEQMPAEFAAFKPGQPFEAIAVYRQEGMEFFCVDYIAKRSSLRRIPAAEQTEIWNSLSTSRELPVANWAPGN